MGLEMKKRKTFSGLSILCLLAVGSTFSLAQEGAESSPLKRNINVVLLDHATDLETGSQVRRNHWKAWEKRTPTFLQALEQICAYQRSSRSVYEKEATLFSILVSSNVSRKERSAIVMEELKRIFRSTGRPSYILSRSTVGHDQLSIVLQDGRDYPPPSAARLIMEFAHYAPPNCTKLFPAERGPFQAPPTMIMDYRPWGDPAEVTPEERAKARWGILEDGYLLPQYILHNISLIEDSIRIETKTFYVDSRPGPGVQLIGAKDYTAAMVFPGVGTDVGNTWERYNTPIISAFESSGKRIFAEPLAFKRIDGRSAQDIYETSYKYARKAFEEDKNPNFVMPQHLNIRGYVATTILEIGNPLRINAEMHILEDKKFARMATTEIIKGLRDAANDFGVNVNTAAFAHSQGEPMAVEGGLAAGRNLGEKVFDSFTSVNGRGGIEGIAMLASHGFVERGNINLIATRGDAWGLPGSVSHWDTIRNFAKKNQNINAYCIDQMSNEKWKSSQFPLFGMKERHSIPVDQPESLASFNSVINRTETRLNMTVQDILLGNYNIDHSSSLGIGDAGIYRRPLINKRQGGILFAVGNRYFFDLLGKSWKLVEESKKAGPDGIFSFGKAKKKIAGVKIADIGWVPPLLVGRLKVSSHDLVAPSEFAMPVGIARLYDSSEVRHEKSVDGWINEPCFIRRDSSETVSFVLPNNSIRDLAYSVSFVERETGTQLSYSLSTWSCSNEMRIDDIVPYEAMDSRCLPDLLARADGSYSLLLAHGTILRFNSDGSLVGVSDRLGHSVRITRNNGRLSKVSCQGGLNLSLKYRGKRVGAIEPEDRGTLINYSYGNNQLGSVSHGGTVWKYDYGNNGILSTVSHSGLPPVSFKSDSYRRLVGFSCKTYDASLNYQDSESMVLFSADEGKRLSWKFGPRKSLLAVLYGTKDAIVFTRDHEDRMIQMAFARREDSDGHASYTIAEVVGAKLP